MLASVAILGLYLPGMRVLFLLAKPLATLAVIALALRVLCDEPRYRRAIVAGLLLGLAGDVLLMLDGEPAFMAGLGSFLLGHLAYLHGYRQRAQLFAVAWAFVLYAVLAYVAVLAAMAAQAAAVWWRRRDAATACAAIGGACFLGSDAILAIDRFALPFVAAQAVLLALYWTAQALIASSVQAPPVR